MEPLPPRLGTPARPSAWFGQGRPRAVRRPGFTLVELLVVIGIIAALIAILLPSVIRARESALSITCLANERSIVQAAMIHALGHQGFVQPCGRVWTPNGALPADMGDASMTRYVYYSDAGVTRPLPFFATVAQTLRVPIDSTSRQRLQASLDVDGALRLFTCPAQPVVAPGTTVSDGTWIGPTERVGYALNEEILGFRPWPYATPKGRLERVKRPATVMLLVDGDARRGDLLLTIWGYGQQNGTLADYAGIDSYNGYNVLSYTRHRGRINVAFCDGHAESVEMGTADRRKPGGLAQVGVSNGAY